MSEKDPNSRRFFSTTNVNQNQNALAKNESPVTLYSKSRRVFIKRQQETGMRRKKLVRYGKPCMSALPPRLGRIIIREIMSAPPFDHSNLDAECKRINRRLAQIKPIKAK